MDLLYCQCSAPAVRHPGEGSCCSCEAECRQPQSTGPCAIAGHLVLAAALVTLPTTSCLSFVGSSTGKATGEAQDAERCITHLWACPRGCDQSMAAVHSSLLHCQSKQPCNSTATLHIIITNGCCRSRWSPPEMRLQALTCVDAFDEVGGSLQLLARPPVDLVLDLRDAASKMGCVAVQDRGVATSSLARVMHDDDLQQPACHQALLTFIGVLLAGLHSIVCRDIACHHASTRCCTSHCTGEQGASRRSVVARTQSNVWTACT